VLRPRWWIPVVLIGIFSTVFINLYSARVGWERVVRQQIEQSSRAESMTPQQREQAIAAGARVAQVLGYGGTVVGSVFYLLVTAAVLLFIVNSLLGSEVKFGSMMGIVSYASLPQIVSAVLATLVMYLKPPDDFDLRNPLAFNAGAFLASDATAWMKALAGSFDLFSFWIMALIAVGISAAAPRIKFGKAFGAVLFPWALYVALKTVAAAAFN